ncbi:MAG: hypothetical protein KGH57_00960 [Candidatus Micrarchaeota archaeon]|nr:hypothetical protein [Candidatus Micrarchaeota archaeon]
MAKKQTIWRNPDWPFQMSFLVRMFTYIVLDLLIINLIVFYLAEKLPFWIVVAASAVEIAALTLAMAFWASPYRLKW